MLTINHTPAEGTLISGTVRGDGSAQILKAKGWRWGRSITCWYIPHSRDRLPKTHLIDNTTTALKAAGFSVQTHLDQHLRPAADIAASQNERQVQRTAVLQARAERKDTDANAAWARADTAGAALPPGGEPIKIGHHSETRHRNALNKAHTRMGQAVAADREATQAHARVDSAAATLGARYSVRSVANRIEKLRAEERGMQRKLDGYTTEQATPYARQIPAATGDHRQQLETSLADARDSITYWERVRAEQIASGEAKDYGPDTITPGDTVKIAGHWRTVVRVNAKTVTVQTDHSWTNRAPYPTLQDHHPAAH